MTVTGFQVYFRNQQPEPGSEHPKHLPMEHVLQLVIDAYTSATERHIEVGDGLEIYIVMTGEHAVEGLAGATDITKAGDAMRTFVVRRELKMD